MRAETALRLAKGQGLFAWEKNACIGDGLNIFEKPTEAFVRNPVILDRSE